jgi:hypothetical protein
MPRALATFTSILIKTAKTEIDAWRDLEQLFHRVTRHLRRRIPNLNEEHVRCSTRPVVVVVVVDDARPALANESRCVRSFSGSPSPTESEPCRQSTRCHGQKSNAEDIRCVYERTCRAAEMLRHISRSRRQTWVAFVDIPVFCRHTSTNDSPHVRQSIHSRTIDSSYSKPAKTRVQFVRVTPFSIISTSVKCTRTSKQVLLVSHDGSLLIISLPSLTAVERYMQSIASETSRRYVPLSPSTVVYRNIRKCKSNILQKYRFVKHLNKIRASSQSCTIHQCRGYSPNQFK